MRSTETITISLPAEVGRELKKVARQERQTVTELVQETLRRYRYRRDFNALAAEARKRVKKLGLTEKDFGGPFAK